MSAISKSLLLCARLRHYHQRLLWFLFLPLVECQCEYFTSGVPEPGDNICHVTPLSSWTAVWRKYYRERIHQVGLWPAQYFGCYGYHFRCSGCSTSSQHWALTASGSVCVLMCVINWCGNVYLAKDCFRSGATHFSRSASPLSPVFWFSFSSPSLPLTYSSPLQQSGSLTTEAGSANVFEPSGSLVRLWSVHSRGRDGRDQVTEADRDKGEDSEEERERWESPDDEEKHSFKGP